MSRPIPHRLAGIAAASLAIVLLAACSKSDPPPAASNASGAAPAKIRYAAFDGVSGLGVRFGIERGFFKNEGLDLELISTRDPLSGLGSGDIDVADFNTTGALVAAGKGVPVSIVASMFRQVGPFYLVGANDIASVADLKGKTVGAAAFGSGLDVYARTILERNGVDLDTVTFVANGVNAAALATVENGSVSATIIHEPFASLAEFTGKGKVLAAGYDYLPRFHTGVILASNAFIASSPDTIRKFLSAYFKAHVYAKEHLDEYKAYYAKTLNVDPKVADAAVARELPIWSNDPGVSLDQLRETQEIQLKLKFQDRIYDAEKFVNLSFVPKP